MLSGWCAKTHEGCYHLLNAAPVVLTGRYLRAKKIVAAHVSHRYPRSRVKRSQSDEPHPGRCAVRPVPTKKVKTIKLSPGLSTGARLHRLLRQSRLEHCSGEEERFGLDGTAFHAPYSSQLASPQHADLSL